MYDSHLPREVLEICWETCHTCLVFANYPPFDILNICLQSPCDSHRRVKPINQTPSAV